ncbi:MAG: cysteine desulfurase NifS [Deltaproteobacteria bacterium]|nr:cysteine desulfurase NifS [Deltaproteobacteria bacterium]
MERGYLDHAATTPVAPAVLEAMLPYFGQIYGNPGSAHSWGGEARRAVEEARGSIAAFLGAAINEIVFTSGGTESNNTVIKGIAESNKARGNHIITSAIEHHAILNPCHTLERKGFEVTYIPVNNDWLVSPKDVEAAITAKTILISIMHANNEIGVIEPLAKIGAIARQHGIPFHTDAVQTFGHIPVNVADIEVDLLSASAHKLYGPKGVGLLYIHQGIKISPLLEGGEQEAKRRSSTLNVSGIIGFAKATELAADTMKTEPERISALRDKLIDGLLGKIKDTHLNGTRSSRLPNNINISFGGVEGEALLLSLDAQGIACSTGSACTSAKLETSHVLKALAIPHHLGNSSLRFSLGKATNDKDIERVLAVLPGVVDRLRTISPFYQPAERED